METGLTAGEITTRAVLMPGTGTRLAGLQTDSTAVTMMRLKVQIGVLSTMTARDAREMSSHFTFCKAQNWQFVEMA